MNFLNFKKIGFLAIFTTVISLNIIIPKEAIAQNNINYTTALLSNINESPDDSFFIEAVKMNFQEKLDAYHKIGLFKNVNNPTFKISLHNEYEDSASLTHNTIFFSLKNKTDFDSMQLSQNTGLFSSDDSKQQLNNEVEIALAHELSHLELYHFSNISQNKYLNKLAHSNIILNKPNKETHQIKDFTQENFSDVNGNIAFMILNNFNQESIQQLKTNYNSRMAVNTIYDNINGEFSNNHNTANSLQKLILMVDDAETLLKLKKITPEESVLLAKDITRDSLLAFISNPIIQNNINNIQNKQLKTIISEYNNSDHHSEVNSTIYADFSSKYTLLNINPKELNTCESNQQQQIKQHLKSITPNSYTYTLTQIRTLKNKYIQCNTFNKPII